jgi:protein SSD1
MMDVGSVSTDDVEALFDDDDDMSELADTTAGVSLGLPTSNRPTQSMPPSPTKNSPSADQTPHRTRSDPKISNTVAQSKQDKQTLKERYMHLFTLREENGDYIQDVKEMTRVPVILRTDLTKSPPCLTIRSVNPYAL